MKRALVAAALAGAVGLLPGAGHADSANVLSCTLSGQVDYASTVGTDPAPNSFTLAGTGTCYQVSTDGHVVTGTQRTADISGVGSGTTSCELNSTAGGFAAAFSTGGDTRDVWEGTFGAAGSAASAVLVSLNSVSHQHFDGADWVTDSTDSIGLGGLNGAVAFATDDVSACAGDGISTTSFSGHVQGAFQETPEA